VGIASSHQPLRTVPNTATMDHINFQLLEHHLHPVPDMKKLAVVNFTVI
jgi:hypothetical protein